MDKRTPFRASLFAVAIASAASAGFAAEPTDTSTRAMSSETMVIPAPAAGYVVSSRGEVVRSDRGECVSTDTGGAPIRVTECGGVVMAQAPMMAPTTAAPTEEPMRRVTLDADTTFAFDSAELTDEGKAQLDNIVEAGQSEDVQRLRIHITGYADRIGTEEYNLALSEERAKAVRDYLVEAGIPTDVVSSEGKGERNPLVQCEGMTGSALVDCLQPNRRSEVEFAALVETPEATAEEAPAGQGEPWAPATDTGTPR